MSKIQNIIDNIRGKNIKQLSNKVDMLSNELEQLKYLLYQTTDITTIPKAKGRLRQYQLILIEYLRIFDFVCRKNNLSYWLDSGALIGAVRHKGFIPWDDDIDIGMPREDYNKLKSVIESELVKYDFIINIGKDGFNDPIIRILHKDWTYSQIDIFPFDHYYKKFDTIEEKQNLHNDCAKANEILKEVYLKGINEDLERIITEINKKYILKGHPSIEKGGIYRGCEFFDGYKIYLNYEDIFPLKELTFEGYNIFVPNNCHNYLTQVYGDYMTYPKQFFQHNNDIAWEKEGKMSTDFLSKIKQIASNILSQKTVK